MVRYLLWWIEESGIWGLEFTILWSETTASWVNTCIHSSALCIRLLLPCTEAKWVDSVRIWEEICFIWVSLHILPTSVRPSARDKLQIFFWDTNFLFTDIWTIKASWILWSCSSMGSILETASCSWFFYVTWHSFTKQTYEILHYKIKYNWYLYMIETKPN